MWVPRVRCSGCRVTHALLPAFVWSVDWTWPRRSGPSSTRWSAGPVVSDRQRVVSTFPTPRPGVGATVLRPKSGAGGRLRGFGRGTGRGDHHPAARCPSLGATCTGCCLACGRSVPGMARLWPVAVRLGRHRRGIDRHQHELALSRRRQTAFHASCPIEGREREETRWNTTEPRPWPCTAGRSSPRRPTTRLTPAERGVLVRAAAGKTHAHPDGEDRRYSRSTIDRWIRAWRRGRARGTVSHTAGRHRRGAGPPRALR